MNGKLIEFQPMPKRFKVWDTKEKKFLSTQGFAILPDFNGNCGVTIPYENCHNPNNKDEDCIDWADADLLTNRYIMCLSTGLFDKDGKEIFEGAILQKAHKNYLVKSEDGKFMCAGVPQTSLKAMAKYGRVIGHILSNPKLLR